MRSVPLSTNSVFPLHLCIALSKALSTVEAPHSSPSSFTHSHQFSGTMTVASGVSCPGATTGVVTFYGVGIGIDAGGGI